MHKNGILRIIESSFAVLLLLSAVLILSSKQRERTEQENLSEELRLNLDEIARNITIREQVLTGSGADSQMINMLKQKSVKQGLNYSVIICNFDPDNACGNAPSIKGEIYSIERIIGATLTSYPSKIIKVYVWKD